MNKFTKGAIATAAGIVLLLGGAGTFALWNDSAAVSAGSINSGALKLTNPTAGAWVEADGTPIADITAFKIVPGDSVRYTRAFTLQASGDNLKATLTVGAADFLLALPADLQDDIDVTFTTAAGAAAAVAGDREITSTDNGTVYTVVVTVSFDASADNTTQLETVNLSTLDIAVNQHL